MLAQLLAQVIGARFGFLGEAANSVGGYQAQAIPGSNGLNAAAMIAQRLPAYVLLNVEPELDCHNPRQAMQAVEHADFVVALTPFQTRAIEYADVILPIAPFTETSGSFVNTEGRLQSFNAAVKALAESRPAWKVLRVLGNLLELQGFEYESTEQVREEALRADVPLDNEIGAIPVDVTTVARATIERVADVPIYFADPLVRRSEPLQKAPSSFAPRLYMNTASLRRHDLAAGQRVRVKQDGGEGVFELAVDEALADGAARLATAHASTADLGAMFGELTVERA